MKAITIHQPWASLIAHGYKRYETRSWRTNYRGTIAIHAGKKIDHQAVQMLAHEYTRIWREISPLPTGVIVAMADLAECWSIGQHDIFDEDGRELKPTPHEYDFGWFAPGRYAWELTNVIRFPSPIRKKGQQGLSSLCRQKN